MRKYLLFCGLLLPIMLTAKEKLDFFLDYNCFNRTGSEKQAVEFYFSVPVKCLQYNDSLQASFSINAKIFDGNKLIASDYFGQYSSLKSNVDADGNGEAPSQTTLSVLPGVYRLKIVLTDLASKDSAVIDIPQNSNKFKVEAPSGKMAISGIQLSSKVVPEGKPDAQFYKNGMLVVPNPRKLFGTHNPFISYYAELYNLQNDKDYRLNWEIYTAEDKFVRKGDQTVALKGSAGTKAIFDKIKIFYLKSGSYKFLLRLTDQEGKDSVFNSNNFYVFRPVDFENKVVAGNDVSDMFDVMPVEKLSEEFEQLSLILDKKDVNVAEQLNENGKRNFLKKYWEEKSVATPDARNRFLQLVASANRTYSTVNIVGWKTDRGRVLIKMGEPDKKDQLTLNTGTIDHEIWLYYNSNNKFVFADTHGLGEFKLLHSDYPGEKSDPNWEKKLKKNKSSMNLDN